MTLGSQYDAFCLGILCGASNDHDLISKAGARVRDRFDENERRETVRQNIDLLNAEGAGHDHD